MLHGLEMQLNCMTIFLLILGAGDGTDANYDVVFILTNLDVEIKQLF